MTISIVAATGIVNPIPADAGIDDTNEFPGTALEGDVVVVITTNDNFNNGVTSPGWTEIYDTGVYTPHTRVYYKVMSATPDTSVDTDASGTKNTLVYIGIYRGVDTTTPVDATIAAASGTTGLPDAPTYTTSASGAGAMRIVSGHLDDDKLPLTAPAGYTDAYSMVGDGTGNQSAAMVCHKAEAGASETVNPDAFGGSGDDEWWAFHFALRAAAGSAAELVADNASSGSFADSPAITQTHLLVADGASSHSVIDNILINQAHVLIASGALSNGFADTVAITLDLLLAVADALSQPAIDGPAVSQTHLLSASDALADAIIDTLSVEQIHQLVAADLKSGSVADAVAVYTKALGVIDDPVIVSRTVVRRIVSRGIERIITSRTTQRTIKQVH